MRLMPHCLRLIALICACFTVLTLTSTVVGSFIPSDRFSAVSVPTNRPPRFTYLIDPGHLLKIEVEPPFDPQTTWNIQPIWDQPGQTYIWQRLAGEKFGDDSTVLYLQDILTGHSERLIDTRENTLDFSVPVQEIPIVSPNGRYFAFGGFAAGNIYVLDTETQDVRQVLNLSPSQLSVNQQGVFRFGGLIWSPNSAYIAFSYRASLYVLSPDGRPPLEVTIPGWDSGQGALVGAWSADSQTVLLSSPMNSGQPPSRIDVNTQRVEVIEDESGIDKTAVQVNWHCDGRWLTYLVPRDVNPRTGLPSGNPPLFAGYIRDMESGEDLALDTILASSAGGTDVTLIRSLVCGDAPVMLISGQVPEGASESQPQPSRVLNMLHLSTKTVTPLTAAGWVLGWDDATKTLTYTTDEGNNLRTVYTRQTDFDAEAIRMGQYTYTPENTLIDFSNDYRYMLVVEGSQQVSYEGRLKKVDLQTGAQVYLTGKDERVKSVVSIPWE